jgi:hypothetical protein
MKTPETPPGPSPSNPFRAGEQNEIPELRFLQGPQSRGFEFGRLLRIGNEFLRGFRRLHFVGPCVTVFGSARFTEENPYYQLARETSELIAKAGFTVMTGGWPDAFVTGGLHKVHEKRNRAERSTSTRDSVFLVHCWPLL